MFSSKTPNNACVINLYFQKEYENIPLANRFTFLVTVISQIDGVKDELQLAAVLLRRIITGSFEEAFGSLGQLSCPQKFFALLNITHY